MITDKSKPIPGAEDNPLASIGGDGVGVRLSAGKPQMGAEGIQSGVKPDDKERTHTWMDALNRYRAGKKALEGRIVEAEQFWKLRHWESIRPENPDNSPEPASGWLVNVILSKHSDAVDAYPEPVCLPREESDKPEAQALSDILPVVFQQNDFAQTWSDVWWYKLKSGTGVYGVFWDPDKLNGLGDIAIKKVDILNLFWEPGVTDIQKSKYIFHVSLVDNDALEEQYPQLSGKLGDHGSAITARYRYDDNISTEDKSSVIDVYYKKQGKLHYAKFVGDIVLFCTEDEPESYPNGLYDHGKYPFEFDPLFPEEGYPNCGYGYVDLCKDPQKTIDILNNAMTVSAVAASTPRWFVREDGGVNEAEYADLTKKFIHVSGNLGEDSMRQVKVDPMPGNAMEFLNQKVNEMKEVSGNRDVNNGGKVSGITAASAIAALQEAGNGLSRDMISSAYRCYRRVVEMAIELIRQFYDLPRQFRILGAEGQAKFVRYDNSRLRPTETVIPGGTKINKPIFDIDVQVQSEAAYTKQAYNDLAIQLYQMGIFNPENAVQAAPMLEMMDFKGKTELLQKVQQNGMLQQQLMMWQQIAISAMQNIDQQKAAGLAQAAGMQNMIQQPGGAVGGKNPITDGSGNEEHWRVRQAREQAEQGAIPR